ncbi:MAG: RNA polymerase factor sigma-54 [Gammaproteobacteria bacterium]|nr:RNA polymerase factor sigma-54 [Gammaproteobacteria bacterium]MDE1983821.1 RNA polymerase factor sigma-54 [Gammaproteobacteria bacterium]MDE2461274.1 RNA polymerase factor sigma-54 [Gammaproteobacteria bacterium]
MKPTLGLQQTQRLSMTPEMRQALELLQMSALELRDTVQNALEHNLLLEREGDSEEPQAPDSAEPSTELPEQNQAADSTEPEELPLADWDSADPVSAWNQGGDDDWPEPAGPTGASLHEHLRAQLELAHLSARDKAIGTLLIDSINDDGYLADNLEELRAAFGDQDALPEPEEMETVLHHLQALDPPGVGARNLAECLAIQLRQQPAGPARELALQLVDKHLEDLAAHAHTQLAKLLNVSPQEIAAAVALVQSLNPRPGTALASSTVDFVVPDVVVSRRDGRWVVELNPETAPRLHVNALYAAVLGRRRNGANADLGRQLQEARWLVRSLRMRNETLLRVAQSIVRRQREFLSRGDEAMRPLMLKEIAAELGLHESTISRVVANKYLAAPRGTLAFRHFFSNELSTDDGGALSATAIRALIRKMVAGENTQHPLSDDRITRELVNRGIRVARRTVAKYRESMAIPAAHERKRFAVKQQHEQSKE